MNGMIKKYLPYAIVIFAVYLIVPAIFLIPGLKNFHAVAYYFILLLTQVVCSAIYCAKHGLDFLFALIAPIAFLFTMLIYAGGFGNMTNIVLLIVYLVAGIFGLFLGDLAFGDERRKKEKKEKQEAEELLLQAKRRDEREKQKMEREKSDADNKPRYGSRSASKSGRSNRYRDARNEKSDRASAVNQAADRYGSADNDDFDYDKYLSDIDKVLDELDERDELNKLLND